MQQGIQNSFQSGFCKLFLCPALPDRPRSLLTREKAIPCVELFRDVAPTIDANFDVCCNKTGDCQSIQDSSLYSDEKIAIRKNNHSISKKSSSGYEFNTPMNNSFDLFQPKSQASMFDICLDSNGAGLDRDKLRKFLNFG